MSIVEQRVGKVLTLLCKTKPRITFDVFFLKGVTYVRLKKGNMDKHIVVLDQSKYFVSLQFQRLKRLPTEGS